MDEELDGIEIFQKYLAEDTDAYKKNDWFDIAGYASRLMGDMNAVAKNPCADPKYAWNPCGETDKEGNKVGPEGLDSDGIAIPYNVASTTMHSAYSHHHPAPWGKNVIDGLLDLESSLTENSHYILHILSTHTILPEPDSAEMSYTPLYGPTAHVLRLFYSNKISIGIHGLNSIIIMTDEKTGEKLTVPHATMSINAISKNIREFWDKVQQS